jgi:(p)ppGpp synthase/HD superfamily hydrolase
MTPKIIVLASNVAMAAHWHQTRKYTGEPYFNHVLAVATQVEAWGGTPEMIAAAYLHDVLEDTDETAERLLAIFGPVVVGYVQELTDKFTKARYPKLNRAERKVAEARRLATASLEARVIKLADMADNTASIEKHDPGFAKTYLREKAFLLSLIGGAFDEWSRRRA